MHQGCVGNDEHSILFGPGNSNELKNEACDGQHMNAARTVSFGDPIIHPRKREALEIHAL